MVRSGRLQPSGVTWDLPPPPGQEADGKGERRRRRRGGEDGKRSRSARGLKRECKGDVTFNSGVLYITDNSGESNNFNVKVFFEKVCS